MTSQELYDHAVSLLARRDYASGELARALSKMTENRENIDKALSRLVECGWRIQLRSATLSRLS